ncbi:MAG: TonB C-terminal domain-containing protein [Deltaproteobacteria bacterium]|nr:TonB C-terminal domain-containing protein [Deltaproteobacteria bacterium]
MSSEVSLNLPPPGPFGRGFDPYKISIRVIAVCVVISLLIHLLILIFAARYQPFADKTLETDRIPIEINVPNQILDSIQTLQKSAEKTPEDAKFASDRNLKADEETSPQSAPTSVPQIRAQPKSSPRAQTKKSNEGIGEKTKFSISQKEMMEDGTLEQETLSPSAINSPGFLNRLKLGEQLKLNAREFDYGQYIIRMKNKLVQQWNPNNTFSPQMVNYNEIRVEIAVILNKLGEIVELRTLNPSIFNAYDQEALRALRESGPFPNPPKSLIQDDGFVYMPWSFTFSIRQWGGPRVE